LKPKLEKIDTEMKSLEDANGKLKPDATGEEKAKYEKDGLLKKETMREIRELDAQIEERVLDSELFLRECKQFMLSRP
jgi:hypothetical protein